MEPFNVDSTNSIWEIYSCQLQQDTILYSNIILSSCLYNFLFVDTYCQIRSQEFAMGGLFWKLETTSNDLDSDFAGLHLD